MKTAPARLVAALFVTGLFAGCDWIGDPWVSDEQYADERSRTAEQQRILIDRAERGQTDR